MDHQGNTKQIGGRTSEGQHNRTISSTGIITGPQFYTYDRRSELISDPAQLPQIREAPVVQFPYIHAEVSCQGQSNIGEVNKRQDAHTASANDMIVEPLESGRTTRTAIDPGGDSGFRAD